MAAISQFHSIFVRVSDKHPCSVCGKNSWCCLRRDGQIALCARVKSKHPYGKPGTGWLHAVAGGRRIVAPLPEQRKILSSGSITQYLTRLGTPPDHLLKQHSSMLGIGVRWLRYMDAHYDGEEAVLVFPMRDGTKRLVGCRKRRRDGRKWSLKHGREGLFFGVDTRPDTPLIVTEGPTDAAAAAEAGFPNVIGRSNCWGGGPHIGQFMQGYPNIPILMLADPNDVGIDGCKAIANAAVNPTIVFAGPDDVRNYTNTKQTNLFQDIQAAVKGNHVAWRVVFRNMRAAGIETNHLIRCLAESRRQIK